MYKFPRLFLRNFSFGRRIFLALFLLCSTISFIYWQTSNQSEYPGITKARIDHSRDSHPITKLIADATQQFEELLSHRSFTL